MEPLIYEKESYEIIGLCIEIFHELGSGLSEIVYKDALEYELHENNIFFEREKEFIVNYKDIVLPHKFYADFVIMDKIIVEVKTVNELSKIHFEQTLNYLHISGFRLGLLLNFKGPKMTYKRLVL